MTAPNPSEQPTRGAMLPPSVPSEHTKGRTESNGCRVPEPDARQIHVPPPFWPRVFPGL